MATTNYKSVKLSTKWTKPGYYFMLVTLVLLVPTILYLSYSLILSFQLNFFIVLLLMIALAAFCFYCAKYLAIGHITDNVFYLRKINKIEKQYSLEQLIDVKVYENRKEKYIMATFEDGTGPEKYLFTNSKMFFAGESKNTETVLREIHENNKTKV